MKKTRFFSLFMILALLLSMSIPVTAAPNPDGTTRPSAQTGSPPSDEKPPEGEKQEAVPSEAAPIPETVTPLDEAPEGVSIEEATLAKIDPLIRQQAREGGSEILTVVVLSLDGVDLSLYGEIIASGSDSILGMQRTLMRVRAGWLVKLASRSDVAAISTTGQRPDPIPPDPEAPLGQIQGVSLSPDAIDTDKVRESLAARAAAQPVSITKPSVDGVSPEAWFENDTQGVAATWALGITGQGDPLNTVKAAVIDTGVDFCNPSLLGRWAVQNSPLDPTYNGWPIAFDGRSMDSFLANFPAAGSGYGGNWGWYVNASRTTASATFVDALYGKTYTIPIPSASGTYRYGYHPDFVWHALVASGSSPVLAVVDSTTPGVYDQVWIDGDWNGTFDTLIDQNSPAGCIDWTGPAGPDGVADDSYGLLYWISDGANPLPGVSMLYGGAVPQAGEVLMLMINNVVEGGGDHGTLCASSSAGFEPVGSLYDWQGVLPSWYYGTPIIQGPGSGGPWYNGMDVIPMGNFYAGGSSFDFYLFTVFGYDGIPGSGDEANIVSMSYGSGSVDDDGWDFQSQYLSAINLFLEDVGISSPIYVSSSGNGGNGYGTVNTPAPVTGVQVGASTQYGPYNVWGFYEGVSSSAQAVYQDVQPWSNRGPSAMSTLSPSVVANGAWGSGATSVNLSTYFSGYAGDGAGAWYMWGGTSRSTPVVVGMLGLIYDAYYQGNGYYPDWREAKALLMNGALDIGYDEFVGGAGQAYALRSALLARGDYGVKVDPPLYEAGSYPPGSGIRYESFAHGLYPGQSDTAVFNVTNPTTGTINLALRAEQLKEIAFYETTLTTNEQGWTGTNYGYGAPDYVLDLTPWVASHPTADLMIVRVSYPFDHFATSPTGAPTFKNRWIGLVYNVYDNGNGVWWTDLDGDGRVDIYPNVPLVDHELDLDDEHIRFSYSYNRNTQQEMSIQRPYQRMGDAIYLGLTHNTNNGEDTTHLIEVIFYEHQDWDQVELSTDALSVSPGGSAAFTATINTVVRGATLLTENFDAATPPALPAGWDKVDVSGTAGDWFTNAGTHHPIGLPAHSSPNLAYFNSNHSSSGSSTRLFHTVGLDLSAAPGAELSFWMYHDTGYINNDRIQVQVSTDGGASWNDLGDPIPRYAGPGINEWRQHTLDLSAYTGGGFSDMRLGFLGISALGNDIHIDDIEAYEISIDAPGEYTGRIVVSDPGNMSYDPHETVIPVQKQVWFNVTTDPVVGGTPRADTPYDNGHIYGPFSWTGRGEVGDWRVYAFNIEDPPPGAVLLVDNQWADYPTDIDTLILDQVPNWDFGLAGGPPGMGWFGPHTMDYLGRGSVRSGTRPNWRYYTNAGTNHEFISAPAYEGLRVMLHHGVLFGGELNAVPFTTTIATAAVSPNPILLGPGIITVSNTVTMTFKSGMDLDGLEFGGAYGWFVPLLLTGQEIYQDNPDDPTTASWIYPMNIAGNVKLEIATFNSVLAPDIDLFLVRDNDSSGTWTPGDAIVASSTTSSSDEHVLLYNVPDGDYLVAVHGWNVSGNPGYFDISIDEVKGEGALSVSGLPANVIAGETYEFTAHVEIPPEPGSWKGLLFFGPPQAPTAIEVEIFADQGSVEKTAWQTSVLPSELVTFTIALTENPEDTVIWSLVDPIPDGLEFVSAQGADYISATNSIVWDNEACHIGWFDATGGTALNLTGDGEANATLPSAFDFYNASSTDMRVGNNGGILFGVTTGDVFADNNPLSGSAPNYFIAPLWDDLDDDTGGVYYDVFGDEPNRYYVIEWFDRPHFNNIGSATLEAVLDEASGDIWFLYQDVDFHNSSYDWGASATIGLRGADATQVTQHSYNTASVWNGWAIQFTPVNTTSYEIALAEPRCYGVPFGSHEIVLTLQTTDPGFFTNTAYVTAGDTSAEASASITVNEVEEVLFTYHDLENVVQSSEDVYLAGSFNGWSTSATLMAPSGDHSVFTATLSLAPGSYEYKYVVKDAGNDRWNWLQSANRTVDITDTMTVHDYRDIQPGYVVLQWPHATTTTVGVATEDIYGQIWADDLTSLPGAPRALMAELGYGSDSDPGSWTTWEDMTWSSQQGNNDEYAGAILPTATGVYSYVVRFDGNWGVGNPNQGWHYADSDGVHPGNPFEIAKAGMLTVIEAAPDQADLAVEKAAMPEPVFVGGEITYLITVTNHGPADATGVTLVDTLDEDVTFVSASTGCTEDEGVVTCDLGDLGMGESTTVTIVVTAPIQAGTVSNTAVVSANEEDPIAANNTAATTTMVVMRIVYLPFLPVTR